MTCYVMDTDHLSLYERCHPQVRDRILQARRKAAERLTVTVVSLEEQYAGRLSQIRKASTSEVMAYRQLQQTYALFSDLPVLEYSSDAEQLFRESRKAGIRIGTQDLRIASIVQVNNGILLTRNRRDFEKVPGLLIQDWSI
jgi:tRNA(fMet)-specific endonuclease VapC